MSKRYSRTHLQTKKIGLLLFFQYIFPAESSAATYDITFRESEALCRSYGKAVNDANTEGSKGGAFAVEEAGKCVIYILPGSEHNRVVNLMDARHPLIIKTADSGDSLTQPDHHSDEIAYTTLSAAPGFQGQTFFIMKSDNALAFDFSIDNTYLNSTINGCQLSGVVTVGEGFLADRRFNIRSGDSGIPTCRSSDLDGLTLDSVLNPSFASFDETVTPWLAGLKLNSIPVNKVVESPNRGGKTSNGKHCTGKKEYTSQTSRLYKKTSASFQSGDGTGAAGGGDGEDPYRNPFKKGHGGHYYATSHLYRAVVGAIKKLNEELDKMNKDGSNENGVIKAMRGQISKSMKKMEPKMREFIEKQSMYRKIAQYLM